MLSRTRKLIGAATAALVLAAPAFAGAHVTLQPDAVPAGGFSRLDVRVPNERDDAATDKVEVRLPDGFLFVSYEPVPGWTVDVRTAPLDSPVESHGDQITEQVKTITWTANDRAAAIQPGQFRDFGLSVGLPEGAGEGEVLTFPAIQTYDSGEVVRWIGAPDSEEPAAKVTLTASEDEELVAAPAAEVAGEGSEDDEDEGAPTWLAIVGAVLGAGGLAAGGAALARGRRAG